MRLVRRLLAWEATCLILLLSIDAAACQHDRDCPAASRCVRGFGQIEGVCERGVEPIEGDERRRVGNPDNPRVPEGRPCEFAGDCEPGLSCVLKPNSSLRVCSR